MNCIVRHKDVDMSFRLRCVAVERERVFGDIVVTQQTGRFIHQAITYREDVLPVNRHKARNQAHEILEAPDFMSMNRRRLIRQRRSVPIHGTDRPVLRRFKSAEDGSNANVLLVNCNDNETLETAEQTKRHKVNIDEQTYPAPLRNSVRDQEIVVSSLVDQLLLDIYGSPGGERGRSESESTASSPILPPQRCCLQRNRLLAKNLSELQVLVETFGEHVNHAGGLLVRQLRRREHLVAKRDKQYDVITAHLQARSEKRSEDTKMRFSVAPQPGESGFTQWLDAMKMVARLPGGIPPEFRKRLWLTLSERHLQQRGVDWRQAEKLCFNEWSNPDDEELGIQIVKDLHRTGCSLFCGAAGRDNQAVLRRVLLGFARWNKSVGYCQGLNVLAALVLQVMDRAEAAAVKVMIYLIEGVLPEGYFADNLRGLSVDMAVFRDLLRMRLPKLSRHLEALQTDAKDKATGSSYEPPLTNVFTMQWFLTLFCHCLPQEAVLRVWDLIFLEGDEVLLRTALAIWEGLADRIMTVTSADEFYSIMGVLTREMLEFTDTNSLIKAIVNTGPLTGITTLREKHRYNITPWARRLSDDDETETEEDERLAVAAAMFGLSQRGKKERESSSSTSLQTVATSNDRERLALDISTLKQQYAKLRERQRQAHIILSAACTRQSLVPSATSQAMNHLLVGKSALVSGKVRQLGPPPGAVPPRARSGPPHSPRNPNRKDKQGVTLHWKDTKRRKDSKEETTGEGTTCDTPGTSAAEGMSVATSTSPRPGLSANLDSDSDSTSTELCDEPDRLSDVDSEEPTSTSDCYVMATDDEKSPRRDKESPRREHDQKPASYGSRELKVEYGQPDADSNVGTNSERTEVFADFEETSISEITDQIRRLSADSEGPASYKVADQVSAEFQRESINLVKTDALLDFCTGVERTIETVDNNSRLLGSFDLSITHPSSLGEDECVSINETEVPIRDEYPSSEDRLTLEMSKSDCRIDLDPGNSNPDNQLVASDSSARIDRVDSKKLFDFTPDLSSTDFDKKLVALDTRVQGLRTELDFGNEASMSGHVSSVEKDNDNAKEVAADFKLPYSRSYVIGHLPISPITLGQKLNYSIEYPSSTLAIKMAEEEPQVSATKKYESQNRSNGVIVNISNADSDQGTETAKRQVSIVRPYMETQSPKTPGSDNSFSSGETMGPDSKTSSLTVSPRTPLSFESRDFHAEKSSHSSVSSESKTLTLRSVGSDDQDIQSKTETRIAPLVKSSSPSLTSFDSYKSKSNLTPKLEASSSSDSCSPDRKKSSERSFSSDLQSPISANSIKFTSNCKGGRGTFSDSPVNLCSATSPFYPIARPNEKTPSPYNNMKQKSSTTDSEETSPEQRSSSSKGSAKLTILESREDRDDTNIEEVERTKEPRDDFCYSSGKDTTDLDFTVTSDKSKTEDRDVGFRGIDYSQRYRIESQLEENELRDQYADKDTVSPLPRDKLEKRTIFSDKKSRSLLDRNNEWTLERDIGKNYAKPFERSSSSLDKRFTDSKLSSSAANEFGTNSLKKRSSDILEDLRHLEVKTSSDGRSENGTLTKKTSDILEDMKSLEARRRDTFSDLASRFSKGRLSDLDTNIPAISRNQYQIEPKIQIQEDSDSFLNTLARVSDSSETGDDKEPKLGVWTKVKPRKRSDNGRRNSDRALKIIQENSAILHRILTCQAKKRLPDLEEISKEITISPINEEISKIFSPILEKIGLNEHEINEELARINFKDFDQLSVTSGSEFDAKINDELSKLSLIDDSEDIDHLDLDEALSRDYLDTREALIDRQINEELSKLLANYEEHPSSSTGLPRQDQSSSSQNISEMEGLDLSSISTNVFSHKSSTDSIETKSELGSIQETVMKPDKSYDYNDKQIPYPPPKYNLRDISPKSDIDIYRELEKLDKISAGEIYPNVRAALAPEIVSTNPYTSDSLSYSERISPILSYPAITEKAFDSSPLRSPYDSYKPYDFKSRMSPRKTPGNPYSVRSYEKPSNESSFEFTEHKSAPSSHIYDISPKRPVLSKETLEFRVRYDDEPSQQIRGEDFNLRPFQTDIADLKKGAAYYDTSTVEPAKYLPRDERGSEKDIGDLTTDYKYNKPDLYHRKYQDVSPQEYSYHHTPDYNVTSSYTMPSPVHEDDLGTHLSVRRRESHSLSPSHQFTSRKLPLPVNTYLTKLSPSLEDVTKRPVSHPEFLDKMNVAKYVDHSTQGSNNYRKSSLSLGNIGHASKVATRSLEETPSPKNQFSPFPVRNTARKPKELGLKLGLYSPTSPGAGQIKRTH